MSVEFQEDGVPERRLDLERPPIVDKTKAAKMRRERDLKRKRIPELPQHRVTKTDLGGPDDPPLMGDAAVVNLRLNGAPFHEIAEIMEFRDAEQAKIAFTRALATTHPPEDWETLRHIEAVRAEQLFRRSLAMASVDFIIDPETGERIPNKDKLRWHEQAGKDLALHATISGAKAPNRLEVTQDERGLDELVSRLLRAQGHQEAIEAEVIELEAIPDEPEPQA